MRLRKYGVEATIDFALYEVDGVDLRVDWTPAAADCEIMKDGGASTQCTNTATDEGSTYSIVLTATEMEAARLVLKVADAATKVFLDKAVIIETYGHASAQHAIDLDDGVRAGLTALPNAAADAAGGLPISDAGALDLDTKLANTDKLIITTGTAQGGAAGNIQLAAAEGFGDNELNGCIVWIKSGTGAGQSRFIDNYTNADDTAVVIPNWATNPDGSSVYVVIPADLRGLIETYKLDHLVAVADSDDVVNNAILAKLAASDGDWSGFSAATDALEAIRDRGDGFWTGSPPTIMQTTTIATLATQISFTLDEGSADDNAYNDAFALVVDQTTGTQQCICDITDYTGVSKTVTLGSDPGIFTMATGDTIYIIAAAPGTAAPTAAQNRAEMDSNSTQLAAIVADTNELQTDDIPGTLSTIDGKIDTVDGNVDSILADTNELQTDWANGGRLDLLIDAILADTGELQTDWTNGGRLDLILDAIVADTNELQADWANGGRLDLLLDAILEDTGTTIPAIEWQVDVIKWLGTACSTPTVAGLPEVDVIRWLGVAVTASASDLPDVNVKEINDSTTAAVNLALATGEMEAGTVSHDNTAASTTVFYSDDITEATADHYIGRLVYFTSGALRKQYTDITDYALDTGEGKFTVTALTEAPADNVTFIIL